MEETALASNAPAASTRDASAAGIRVDGASAGLRAHLANLGQLLGSHAGLAVCGLASLPILARNLGTEAYGRFSLFVLALGALSNLDVARPILVRELSRERGGARTDGPGASQLAASSAWVLTLIGAVIGGLLGGPWVALALAVSLHLHALTAASFAAFSADGRVGVAGSIRNVYWTVGLVSIVALSFVTTSMHAWIWVFTAASAATLITSQRLSSLAGSPFGAPSFSALRSVRVQASDVFLFAVASAVVSASDRFLLEGSADAASFGRYTAQYDIAVKINVLSTALCSVVYPSFSRMLAERSEAEATRRIVSLASRLAGLYFAGLLTLILFHRPILDLVLGQDFLGQDSLGGGATIVYPFLLVGIFIHLFGFLMTPYQRARGDFATHRRVYGAVAVLMIACGLVLVPRFGAMGALLTYMTARLAEISLVCIEARRAGRDEVPAWRLVALGLMVATLAAAAWATGPGALLDPAALLGWSR